MVLQSSNELVQMLRDSGTSKLIEQLRRLQKDHSLPDRTRFLHMKVAAICSSASKIAPEPFALNTSDFNQLLSSATSAFQRAETVALKSMTSISLHKNLGPDPEVAPRRKCPARNCLVRMSALHLAICCGQWTVADCPLNK